MQEAVERYVAASESLRKIFANVPSESTWLDDVVVDFIKSVVQVRCAAAGMQRWLGLGLVPDTHHYSMNSTIHAVRVVEAASQLHYTSGIATASSLPTRGACSYVRRCH